MREFQGVCTDIQCFSALFDLCGNSKLLDDEKKVHDYFLQSVFQGDLHYNNKIIEIFDKCGSMIDARRVFVHMPNWNIGYLAFDDKWVCNNGLGDDGLQLFEEMRELRLQPTE